MKEYNDSQDDIIIDEQSDQIIDNKIDNKTDNIIDNKPNKNVNYSAIELPEHLMCGAFAP
ncbi:MAG: hypothetical protein K6B68_04235 [Eubacterium sp.]|nr:hypothetical protein [Eubacterium sp.]